MPKATFNNIGELQRSPELTTTADMTEFAVYSDALHTVNARIESRNEFDPTGVSSGTTGGGDVGFFLWPNTAEGQARAREFFFVVTGTIAPTTIPTFTTSLTHQGEVRNLRNTGGIPLHVNNLFFVLPEGEIVHISLNQGGVEVRINRARTVPFHTNVGITAFFVIRQDYDITIEPGQTIILENEIDEEVQTFIMSGRATHGTGINLNRCLYIKP